MKRILATILCLTIIMSLGASIGLAKEFPDVDASHWAYKYIDELSNNGVINGYDDGSFNPQGTITRAEFIKLIVSTVPDILEFTEKIMASDSIEETNWFDKYVVAAGAIINALPMAYSEEELNEPITRVEMAFILNQFCNFRGINKTEEKQNVVINQDEYTELLRKYSKDNNYITDDKLSDEEFYEAFANLDDEQREKVLQDMSGKIELQTIPEDEYSEAYNFVKQKMVESKYLSKYLTSPNPTDDEVEEAITKISKKDYEKLQKEIEEAYIESQNNKSYEEEWAIYEFGKKVMIDEGYFPSGEVTGDEFSQVYDNLPEIERMILDQKVAERYYKQTHQVFNDVSNLSASNLFAIVNVKDYGIINGYEDGSFKPDGKMTRAEASTVIYRYLDAVEED